MWYNSKEFKKLNSMWQEKLKETNFVDIEDAGSEYAPLPLEVDRSTARFKDQEAVLIYFTNADTYLKTGTFLSEKEKNIWRWHCQGLSITEISRHVKLSRGRVFQYVKQVRHRMNNE